MKVRMKNDNLNLNFKIIFRIENKNEIYTTLWNLDFNI